MKQLRFIALMMVLFLAACGQSVNDPPAGRGPEEVLRLPLNEVPQAITRRALWHLEEVRDTDMAPGWEKARLADTVALFHRPDITGVAYYEFPISESADGGFIIISSGVHDFPTAHWDFKGAALSDLLEQQANKEGKRPARFYKLDTLAYMAEDAAGERVAKLGNELLKVTGTQMSWLERKPDLGRAYSEGSEAPDSEGESFESNLVRSGQQESSLRLEAWSSWQALKEGYTQTYALFIAALKRDAAEDWQVLESEANYGEGLFAGEVRQVAAPGAVVNWRTTGAGADYVTVKKGSLSQPGVMLEVASKVPEKLRFGLELRYENGDTEALKFFISPRGLAPQSNWSAWTTYWADGRHTDQPLYGQQTYNGCAVGCGPVSWGMLFAWGDYQAENGNSYWAPRCGLYGGCGVAAPLTQDSGVEDMTEEINDYVDTFCSFGSGATTPWDMPDAALWFNGRTGTDLDAHWNSLGLAETRLREYARNSIRDRDTPAVIGTGWLTHYPMAYGYRYRSKSTWFGLGTSYEREFYVNQGWYGALNGWVSASTWFSGEISP